MGRRVVENLLTAQGISVDEETLAAVVVLKPGATATAEELRAFCRPLLAAFKVPQTFILKTRAERPGSLRTWAGAGSPCTGHSPDRPRTP